MQDDMLFAAGQSVCQLCYSTLKHDYLGFRKNLDSLGNDNDKDIRQI